MPVSIFIHWTFLEGYQIWLANRGAERTKKKALTFECLEKTTFDICAEIFEWPQKGRIYIIEQSNNNNWKKIYFSVELTREMVQDASWGLQTTKSSKYRNLGRV